jgi:hypothetical protein
MHNLFSRQLSASEKRRHVISPGHLGKTFRVDTREIGVSGRLLFEDDDRSPRLGRIADSNSKPKGRAISSSEIQPPVSNAFAEEAFRSLRLFMSFLCRRVESKALLFRLCPVKPRSIRSLCKIFRNFQSPVHVEVSMGTFPNPIAASREIHTYTELRELIYRDPSLWSTYG